MKARPDAAASRRRGSPASRCRTCAFPGSRSPGKATTGGRRASASALDIMIEGPLGAAAFNNEFGRPNILGYFRTFETQATSSDARRAARLSQADHDRRRRRQRAAHARREVGHSARREDHRARRSRDADRAGRRRCVLGGQRRERRGSRLRLRAARQSRDPAACAGSHRSVLGAGRSESDPADPRRRRRRPVERDPGIGRTQRSRRATSICARCRRTSRACRRSRSGATKRRSATCSSSPPGAFERFAALCERERCPYAVVGETTDDGWLKVGDPSAAGGAGRSAARSHSRQAAEDDARCAARGAAVG